MARSRSNLRKGDSVITTTSGTRLIASDASLTDQALRALATAEGLLMGVDLHTDFTSGIETDRVEAIADVAHAWVNIAQTYAGMRD